MNYISRHYNPIKISEFLPNEKSDRSVCVTFDDGLASTFHTAWPILTKLHLPAACFVLPELSEKGLSIWADDILGMLLATSREEIDLTRYNLSKLILPKEKFMRLICINQLIEQLKNLPHKNREDICAYIKQINESESGRNRNEFRLMTKDQIIELSKSYEFEIGGHTNNHPILSSLETEQQENEIKGCLEKLNEWGISYPPVFAYPNGRPEDYNQDSIEILKKNGIKTALTTIDGLHCYRDDPYQVKRIAIGGDMGKNEFKARLSGFFYFLKNLSGR